MLQPGRLGVSHHPVQAQHVGEPSLHDAVAPDDRLGCPASGDGQLDVLASVHTHHSVACHPPQCDRHRWPADPEPVGETRAAWRLALRPHVIDRLEVARDDLGRLAVRLI